MNKLLTRDEFREGVFKRDNHQCVICKEPAKDAHHIMERRLFHDGGYYLDNGASLCHAHHLQAEMTLISTNELREAIGIQKVILPEHLYDDQEYDKWGNIILPNGSRLKGELFFDESVQKILDQGNVLDLFTDKIKYPRTHHLPWSEGMHDDDRMLSSTKVFENQRVIVTEKLDGENCLDGDTLISLNNTKIKLKDLYNIDYNKIEILSFNELENIKEVDYIDNIILSEEEDEWYELELVDGTIITITGNHRVYLPELKCYRKVSELSLEDKLLQEN